MNKSNPTPHRNEASKLLRDMAKRLAQELACRARPAEPAITVNLRLTTIQAKAVFDALAALSEEKRDA